MNKEIKYRLSLKRKDDIQLVEFTFEQLLIGAAFVWMLDNGYSREDIISTDEYTGLKDKNAKEIYKGDIIQNPIEEHNGRFVEVVGHGIYEIKWREDIYMVVGEGDGEWLCLEEFTNCELIGNIYQNPDLLK